MKCVRNKATALLIDIAHSTEKNLTERMQMGPYTISTDGSNDASSKQYPLVVRTLDPMSGMVHSELLSLPVCTEASTGENIFLLLDKELESRSIPWENCLALGCDNASVMTGHKKGVFAFVKAKQSQVFLTGCTFHLVLSGARKAAEALPGIDEVLIDVFYYFNKSDKRKSDFRGTQDLYDTEQKRMLKHVCTRWLSIGRCLERLLHNWDALKVYFKSQHNELEKKHAKKSVKITSSLNASKSADMSDVLKSSDNLETNEQTTTKGKQKSSMPSEEGSALKKTEDMPHDPYAERKVEGIFNFVRSPTNKLYVLFLNYTVHVYDEVLRNL